MGFTPPLIRQTDVCSSGMQGYVYYTQGITAKPIHVLPFFYKVCSRLRLLLNSRRTFKKTPPSGGFVALFVKCFHSGRLAGSDCFISGFSISLLAAKLVHLTTAAEVYKAGLASSLARQQRASSPL